MSAWPGKFVVGLTGNIATGKSVVRKMLEHLGAYGIDADALGHRAIATGAPGHKAVVDNFGKWVLAADGQIDRSKLGQVVFSDAEALEQLEGIIHPLVGQAIDYLIQNTSHDTVVIEAIKLLESEYLMNAVDAVWVTFSPPELQLKRLQEKRGMSEQAALLRINSQSSQESKMAKADLVIRNVKSFENTWDQVVNAWQRFFPKVTTEPVPSVTAPVGELSVKRARPDQAGQIAELITRLSNGKRTVSKEDVMEAFGEKAYLFLYIGEKISGLVGWQVENLVARTNEVYLDRGIPMADAMKTLMDEVELASKQLQCEASLLFLPAEIDKNEQVWKDLGYEQRTIDGLSARAWQDAARESMPENTILLFKQLRVDRVLRPM
jgi:dephospho-CoA kinase